MPSRSLSRRSFGKAALVVTTFASSTTLASQQEEKPKATALEATADALVEIVKLRHGAQLDDKKLARVRQSVLSGLTASARIRQMKLRNQEDPAFVFTADLP